MPGFCTGQAAGRVSVPTNSTQLILSGIWQINALAFSTFDWETAPRDVLQYLPAWLAGVGPSCPKW